MKKRRNQRYLVPYYYQIQNESRCLEIYKSQSHLSTRWKASIRSKDQTFWIRHSFTCQKDFISFVIKKQAALARAEHANFAQKRGKDQWQRSRMSRFYYQFFKRLEEVPHFCNYSIKVRSAIMTHKHTRFPLPAPLVLSLLWLLAATPLILAATVWLPLTTEI